MFICEQWSTSEALRSEHATIFTTRLRCSKNSKDIYNKGKVLSLYFYNVYPCHSAKQDLSPCIWRHKGTPHCSHAYEVSKVWPWPSLRFLPAFAHMAQALFLPSNFPRKCPRKFSSVVTVEAARFPEFEGHLYPL